MRAQRVTPEDVVRELRRHNFGLLSTVDAQGRPHAAGVNCGVARAEAGVVLYVMTRRHLQKAENIARDPIPRW